MSAIDDLNTAVTGLTTTVTAQNSAIVDEIAAIVAALSASTSNDPAIEQAVTSLNALGVTVGANTAQIASETASLQPPAPPAPSGP